MSIERFRMSLTCEDEEKVKEFLVNFDINKPEDGLGHVSNISFVQIQCVSDFFWFIILVCKSHSFGSSFQYARKEKQVNLVNSLI